MQHVEKFTSTKFMRNIPVCVRNNSLQLGLKFIFFKYYSVYEILMVYLIKLAESHFININGTKIFAKLYKSITMLKVH